MGAMRARDGWVGGGGVCVGGGRASHAAAAARAASTKRSVDLPAGGMLPRPGAGRSRPEPARTCAPGAIIWTWESPAAELDREDEVDRRELLVLHLRRSGSGRAFSGAVCAFLSYIYRNGSAHFFFTSPSSAEGKSNLTGWPRNVRSLTVTSKS
jgi:hypothetical protein